MRFPLDLGDASLAPHRPSGREVSRRTHRACGPVPSGVSGDLRIDGEVSLDRVALVGVRDHGCLSLHCASRAFVPA